MESGLLTSASASLSSRLVTWRQRVAAAPPAASACCSAAPAAAQAHPRHHHNQQQHRSSSSSSSSRRRALAPPPASWGGGGGEAGKQPAGPDLLLSGGAIRPTAAAHPPDSGGGGGGRDLSRRLQEAPSVTALEQLIPELAAAGRPHQIAEAWVRLAQVVSLEGRSRGRSSSNSSSSSDNSLVWWDIEATQIPPPSRAPSAAAAPGGVGSGGRGSAGVEGQRALSAVSLQLNALALQQMAAMQFGQLSELFWAWARLAQRAGGRPPVGAETLRAAAARVAECRTDKEQAGRVPAAAVGLARLAWGAASLRVLSTPLWHKLGQLAAPLAADAGPWEAASLMWAFARARALEGKAAEVLCARVAELAPELGPADVANIVWALGAARERRRALLPALVAAAVRLRRRMRPRELSAVAWGFAQLWGLRRPLQQEGRQQLLHALSEAAARLAPKMGLRQAITTAWALTSLAVQQAPRSPSAADPGGAARALAVSRQLLRRAGKLGLQRAALEEVCMVMQTLGRSRLRRAPEALRSAAAAATEGAEEGQQAGGAAAGVDDESDTAHLVRQVAAWVLAAPAEHLPADAVAALLPGLQKAAAFLDGTGGGGGGSSDPDVAAALAALVARAGALAESSSFQPSQLPRVAAALGALAAPARMRQQWLVAGGSSSVAPITTSSSGRAAGSSRTADAARGVLEQLALPAAAVAGRLKLEALADIACGYAAAGLHLDELFDVVAEMAQRPRVLHPAGPWECVRLLWAFAAAGRVDEELFASVCDALAPWARGARHPGALSRLAWACATAGFDDDGGALFDSIATAAASERFLAACQPRDVAGLAWALSVVEGRSAASRCARGAALGALGRRGAGMLAAGALAPAQLAKLCWGLAAAGAYDAALFEGVAAWAAAAARGSPRGDGGSSSMMLPPLSSWSPKDTASLAWSLAQCRHVTGQSAPAALLALAAHCAGGAKRGEPCSAEDASRAAWALAWGGLLNGGGGGGGQNGGGSGGAAPPCTREQQQAALQLVRQLAAIAVADLDSLEPTDLAWLAWVIATTAAAAQASLGPAAAAGPTADARAQLAAVHACAAGWGPGVFGASDAHLLYTAHEWAHRQAAAPARAGGKGTAAAAATGAKILAAGKRTALRHAATARGGGLARAVLSALQRALEGAACTARPALPEAIAPSARSAAQLAGLEHQQLLPQITVECSSGGGSSGGSSRKGHAGACVYHLILVPSTEESLTQPPAACGWAAAAAQLLGAAAAAGAGAGGQAVKVVVLLQSEVEAVQRVAGEGDDGQLGAWLKNKVLGL